MSLVKKYHSDLVKLLKGICDVPSALNTGIHGIELDSRRVKTGDLFIALSGQNSTALDFVPEAIERGAVAVLIDVMELEGDADASPHEDGFAVEIYVPNLRALVGEIAHRFYGKPSEDMSVIAVTGTNGKTSITHYIAQLFGTLNCPAGVLGTIGYGLVEPGFALKATSHTTPDSVQTHRCLAEMRDLGAQVVAMEVSSHGLAQGRINGVVLEGAVYSNLSRDHLDYHGSMDSYADTKAKLFAWPRLKFAVLNGDDAYLERMKAAVAAETKVLTYSARVGCTEGTEISVEQKAKSTKLQATVATPKGEVQLSSELVGDFNLSNLLAVIGVAVSKGVNLSGLEHVNKIVAVPGRMEAFQVKGSAKLVVDYAHTPDALQSALTSLRPMTKGQLIVVFGCGGDRDKGKRAEMATIAQAFADSIWVTNDNPRTESPDAIFEDICAGFTDTSRVKVVGDRRKAIEQAFTSAKPVDTVLIAGKGHETYQEINGERSYFSDADICRALLQIKPSTSALEEHAL